MSGWDCALYLEKGHVFEGRGFGSESPRGGEVVFNTGMSGYQEIFTDPSYHEQVVVMGYPHIGNTGVNWEDLESKKLYLSGVVVREYCHNPSSWRAKQSLDEYLNSADVPGISDIDTRHLTQILRDEGAQRGIIFPTAKLDRKNIAEFGKSKLADVEEMEGLELVSRVSCKQTYDYSSEGNSGTVVVYDYGVKTNILRSVAKHGFKVKVVPYNMPYQEVVAMKPKAVLLSNGPGDPGTVKGAVEQIQGLLGKTPVMGICMGHQLLGRAIGATTYKLKFGHHGINHPVLDGDSKRVIITSQNHGFSVKADDLRQKDITISHISLNDDTVEGFYSKKMRFYGVQFHPEAKPGPNDASSIFDHFVKGFMQ